MLRRFETKYPTYAGLAAACALVCGTGMLSAQTLPTPNGVIYLSSAQYVSVRFPNTTQAMMPAVRAQLASTAPNAVTDQGPIDWQTANFSIISFDSPSLTFKDIVWNKVGGGIVPIVSPIGVEAYFNCSSQIDERNVTQSDVKTSEVEDTRTLSKQATDRVKASVSVNYSSPTGGLGGEASKEWERTVVQSNEYVNRTKETLQKTNEIVQKLTVLPFSVRVFEYSTKTEQVRYHVTGKAVIDTAVAAVYTRPSYETQEIKTIPSTTFGTIKFKHKVVHPAKEYRFDLGKWSYYLGDDDRAINAGATVDVTRETTFTGPTEIIFKNVAQCVKARTSFQAGGDDVASLVAKTEGLVGNPK